MIFECCGRRLDWRNRRGPHGDHDVEQAKCLECSVQYERRPGLGRFYVFNGYSRTCSACGGTVHNAPVAHTILISGIGDSGQVKYELVPSCDHCDARPEPIGNPITVDFRPTGRFAEAS
jgi:hypothetical protein